MTLESPSRNSRGLLSLPLDPLAAMASEQACCPLDRAPRPVPSAPTDEDPLLGFSLVIDNGAGHHRSLRYFCLLE